MYPDSIGHRKGPAIKESTFRPTYTGMKDVGPRHITDSAESIFGNAILVMSSNATEGKFLFSVITMIPKFFRIKHSIVCMNSFDPNSDVGRLPLEQQLASNRVAG